MKYSIDTSAILDGWVRYYPLDVFPAIWEKIDGLIESDIIKASEEVLVELEKKDDSAYKWAKERSQLFMPIDEDIQMAVREILDKYSRLVDTRRGRSTADPFVIGLAKLNNCTLVTGEKPSNRLDKPNIPDVCDDLGINWINLLQLLRAEGWVFRS